MKEKNKIDWSKGDHKKAIIEQRKNLWKEDTLKMIADWLPLKPEMIMLDVGCGLGYNGFTYWKYFGKNGVYLGVDISEDLIKEAKTLAKEWALGGKAEFKLGSVYKLPFKDNSADITICQTLLMHLKEPKKSLQEMKRVTKHGGLIVCVEPDNLSNSMRIGYSSLPELTTEQKILLHRVHFIVYEGHKKLGFGDYAIANKIPKMMSDLDLYEIDIICNDKCFFLIPPYETEEQQRIIEKIQKNINKKDTKDYYLEGFKDKFFAGGGSKYLYYKYKRFIKEHNWKAQMKEQLSKKSFYRFGGASFFYVIRGKKK